MKKVVIVGNGMVGYKFCEKFRSNPGNEAFELVVFGEEARPAYDRVHLSDYFSGQDADKLLLAPASWYAANDITLLTGELIKEINPVEQYVISHKNRKEYYDFLVLATGSMPFVPPIEGVDKEGVFVYRTIEDLRQIMDYGRKIEKAAVLGGGLLGLEAAKALMDMALETHVIEFNDRLMPRQLDQEASETLLDTLTGLGLHIHLNKQTIRIDGAGRMDNLIFADETSLKADMLVISAGIRPRDEVAGKAGIARGERGGVIVNPTMQTNFSNVYAIGEVALVNNFIYGLVAPGYEMAEVAAQHIIGGEKEFRDADLSSKLKLAGVDVASFGDPFGDPTTIPIVYKNAKKGLYKRINVTGDGKYITGGILVGDASAYNMLLQMVKNRTVIPPEPEDLILGSRAGENPGMGVESLPDTAQICSCENVSKGAIEEAIKRGCDTLSLIKKDTKACTGCAGCAPMVNDLIKHTLASMGKEVKNHLCEHFPYSRQELFDVIRIDGIVTYNELLDKHGTGDGCEICKPAVASLLASIWNDHIFKQDTIQDTNDRFLANIQRGGSYSVVPRIPGGEITPDKLITIGEVAKKYNLYTKITGGQRIDMFGARLDELPLIWEELIAAGFESGHAYGKALRTVKSCVGSTWCRYGVQDSVGFAIEVENRYKGLRAPHKIKSAVSGCIRECAEAQSKDFGIIATEKGWNLYVCGNGGAKPQHAKLLVADISREDCIRYIDRFLMFYIKTAEPLARTATWLNKLEGGIDYLRQVVVDDSLGLGEQLEKEMQELIDKYECEWKAAIGDPAVRSRFRHFINAGEPDPEMVFEEARGQRFPKPW